MTLSYVFVNWCVHFHCHVSMFAYVKFQTNLTRFRWIIAIYLGVHFFSGHSVYSAFCKSTSEFWGVVQKPRSSSPKVVCFPLRTGLWVGQYCKINLYPLLIAMWFLRFCLDLSWYDSGLTHWATETGLLANLIFSESHGLLCLHNNHDNDVLLMTPASGPWISK